MQQNNQTSANYNSVNPLEHPTAQLNFDTRLHNNHHSYHPKLIGYCYLRAIPFHLHDHAGRKLGPLPTADQVLDYIDLLNLQDPLTLDFYSTAEVFFYLDQFNICHLTTTNQGISPIEALNLLPPDTRVGYQFDTYQQLELLVLLLLASYTKTEHLWLIYPFAAILVQITAIVTFRRYSLLLIIFYLQINSLPAYCWFLVTTAGPITALATLYQLHQTEATTDPTTTARRATTRTARTPPISNNNNNSHINQVLQQYQPNNTSKQQPTNNSDALKGDILLDNRLGQLLNSKKIRHTFKGPLRDFLRSKKVQVIFARRMNLALPTSISGNAPSTHTLSSIIEQILLDPTAMAHYLDLCSAEIDAQLANGNLVLPIKKLVTE